MVRKELDVLCEDSNYAVVRMPGRNYPGVVIQGDSFANLVGLARELISELERRSHEEAKEIAEELFDLLAGRQQHYEQVLLQEGIELPYV